MKKQKLQDILKLAVEMEQKGYDFYIETSKKTINPLGKSTFKALAEDEGDHIKAVKSFYSHFCEGKACPNIDAIIKNRSEINKKGVFMETLKGFDKKININTDDVKAYKIAMELENGSLKLYKDLLSKTDDKKLKKLIKFLINEENTHYDLLQSTFEYLSNPGDWFTKEERPIVEG